MSPSVTRFGLAFGISTPDGLLARDRREDPDLGRRERVREVVLERRDLRHLRAGRELQLVAGDPRAGDLADDGRVDAEVRERLRRARRRARSLPSDVRALGRLRALEHAPVGEHVLGAPSASRRRGSGGRRAPARARACRPPRAAAAGRRSRRRPGSRARRPPAARAAPAAGPRVGRGGLRLRARALAAEALGVRAEDVARAAEDGADRRAREQEDPGGEQGRPDEGGAGRADRPGDGALERRRPT